MTSARWRPDGRRGRPSGGPADEVVIVELEQVVGGHAETPLGADGGSAAAVETGGAAVGFGVAKHRLDDVLSLPVERLAVLGGQHTAHEVIDPAAPARPGRGRRPDSGGIKTGMPSPVSRWICWVCQ